LKRVTTLPYLYCVGNIGCRNFNQTNGVITTIYQDSKGVECRASVVRTFSGTANIADCSIKIVTAGTEHYSFNAMPLSLTTGNYTLVNSYSGGSVMVDNDATGICIDLTASAIEYYVRRLPNAACFSAYLLSDELYTQKCQHPKLMSLCKSLALHPNANTMASLLQIIIEQQMLVFEQLKRMPHKKRCTRQHIYHQLSEAVTYIQEHLSEPLPLAVLAAKAALSKYEFIRQFKLLYAITPHQYVLNQRLQKGNHLLQSGSTIKEVALEVGFADSASFSKAYKKHFRAAPSYRF
jgi:AraC-like DNA-binding protein